MILLHMTSTFFSGTFHQKNEQKIQGIKAQNEWYHHMSFHSCQHNHKHHRENEQQKKNERKKKATPAGYADLQEETAKFGS